MPSRPDFSGSDVAATTRQRTYARSILKRTLLGVVLLSILVSSGAWLMHAGIEAEAETANEVAISEPADRTR